MRSVTETVGATTNPVIVGNVLKKELHLWEGRIRELIAENPEDSYEDISWRLNEEMAVEAGNMLLPVFEESKARRDVYPYRPTPNITGPGRR